MNTVTLSKLSSRVLCDPLWGVNNYCEGRRLLVHLRLSVYLCQSLMVQGTLMLTLSTVMETRLLLREKVGSEVKQRVSISRNLCADSDCAL